MNKKEEIEFDKRGEEKPMSYRQLLDASRAMINNIENKRENYDE